MLSSNIIKRKVYLFFIVHWQFHIFVKATANRGRAKESEFFWYWNIRVRSLIHRFVRCPCLPDERNVYHSISVKDKYFICYRCCTGQRLTRDESVEKVIKFYVQSCANLIFVSFVAAIHYRHVHTMLARMVSEWDEKSFNGKWGAFH